MTDQSSDLSADPEAAPAPASEEPAPDFLLLKIICGVMGVALLGGLVLMATLIATGAHKKDDPAPVARDADGAARVETRLAAGERIVETQTGGGVVTLRIEGDEGGRVEVYDARSGRLRMIIDITQTVSAPAE